MLRLTDAVFRALPCPFCLQASAYNSLSRGALCCILSLHPHLMVVSRCPPSLQALAYENGALKYAALPPPEGGLGGAGSTVWGLSG